MNSHLLRPLSVLETALAILTDPGASLCLGNRDQTLWLPSIYVWCRCDGSRIAGALRGCVWPSAGGRWLIRSAVACRRLPIF